MVTFTYQLHSFLVYVHQVEALKHKMSIFPFIIKLLWEALPIVWLPGFVCDLPQRAVSIRRQVSEDFSQTERLLVVALCHIYLVPFWRLITWRHMEGQQKTTLHHYAHQVEQRTDGWERNNPSLYSCMHKRQQQNRVMAGYSAQGSHCLRTLLQED